MTEKELRLRSDALDWREVDGEIVALDAGTSMYFAANPTGTLLWRELASGTTRDRLVTRLAQEFELELEPAGADVDRFLAQLADQGLLEE